jgi:hypothetical protein
MPVYCIMFVNRSNSLIFDHSFNETPGGGIHPNFHQKGSDDAIRMASYMSSFSARVKEISPNHEAETGLQIIEGEDHNLHCFRSATHNTIVAISDPRTNDLRQLFSVLHTAFVEHVVMHPCYVTDHSGAAMTVKSTDFPVFTHAVCQAVERYGR